MHVAGQGRVQCKIPDQTRGKIRQRPGNRGNSILIIQTTRTHCKCGQQCVLPGYAAFRVFDKLFYFLVDTGASVSIFPSKLSHHLHISQTFVRLTFVNDKAIDVRGECSLVVSNEKLRRSYRWCFVIADIQQPTLGANFLRAYKISVSCPT